MISLHVIFQGADTYLLLTTSLMSKEELNAVHSMPVITSVIWRPFYNMIAHKREAERFVNKHILRMEAIIFTNRSINNRCWQCREFHKYCNDSGKCWNGVTTI